MKALKIVSIIVLVIVVCIGGVGWYLKVALPNTGPAQDITIEPTATRVERGRYLAHHVSVCMDCHSTRNWSLFSGPITPGSLGGGGEAFTEAQGFPGNIYAPNLTPFALGSWTDGELLRAITTGVNKNGKALFPLMAYHRFGRMDREDVYSIIAYLRTLPPVEKQVPVSTVNFPLNFLINTLPQPASFTTRPRAGNSVAYGAYLVNAAGCVDCHSKTKDGKVIAGTEFGGGTAFPQPAGVLYSPNITFDAKAGIANWSKAFFIKRFKRFADSSYHPIAVGPKQLNSPMPWTMFSGMTPRDLGAIYDYLKTVKPISN